MNEFNVHKLKKYKYFHFVSGCLYNQFILMRLIFFDAMNVGHARAITNTCERCHSKMQVIAEMLVLTCDARPIRTDSTLSSQIASPSVLRDKIFSTMKSILTLMKAIVTHVHMIATKWLEICEGIQELSSTAITFTELCTHSAYLVAVNCKGCEPAEEGLVDKYNVGLAGLEIKISCNRLKRARIEELSPQLIIDLCSNISRHISVITDICRVAGEKVNDDSTEDQFKLCVKSVTCAAGCLIASIKTFKSHPSSAHHSRVLVFCEPVLASSNALVSFATEEDFIGRSALLTPEARDTQKAVLGMINSIMIINFIFFFYTNFLSFYVGVIIYINSATKKIFTHSVT